MKHPTPPWKTIHIGTYFPEIFGKYGIQNETPQERAGKGTLIERRSKAVRIIRKLKGWRSEAWNLKPVLWLEEKAIELCEKADTERAERAAKSERQSQNGKKAANAV